jgi:rod shape-determining protein MreC
VYRKQVRRRRAVLALLVVGSFALLTITYGQDSDGLQRAVSAVFSPVQSISDRALKPARDLVNWFDETFDARGRNARLHTELEAARKEAVGASAALAENAELRKLVELDRSGKIPGGYQPVSAEVIARSPTVWYSDVTIDQGSDEGIAVNDPVVNGDGLIGSVSAVTGSSAQVALLADHSSAITAKVVPIGIEGVVRPEVGDPSHLILDFINSAKRAYKGLAVVTAGWRGPGIASRFPPNIPIGEVTKAGVLEQEAQQQVHLRPYADLRDLSTVQVLTGGWRG